MIAIVVSLVVVAVAAMFVVSERRSVDNMKKLLKQAQEDSILLGQKISNSRDELKKSKEELEREKSALRDAREQAKKKLRRAQAEVEQKTSPEAAMTDKILEDKEKAIFAMETQIEQLKKEQSHNEESLRVKISSEFNQKEQEKTGEIAELKKKINDLQEELKKQKRLMRPEGNKIDLKSLPDEAASEFSRVFRKAEQHERLHGIARAKLHLAQEKFTELQKRYFSVCRELALMAGNKATEPASARDVAEKMVAEHNPPKAADADHS
jgi:hypothetical protein